MSVWDDVEDLRQRADHLRREELYSLHLHRD
jgi:hypothetical protein